MCIRDSYRTTAQGIELEVMDAEEKRLAMLYFRWDEVVPLLRGMYALSLIHIFLTGQTIDLDTIQAIDYYRDNPLVQKAVKELAATMPEMEVLGADANRQEALFLINDTTYLHIQPCDSGWDYTLYDAASMKELDGGDVYKRQEESIGDYGFCGNVRYR